MQSSDVNIMGKSHSNSSMSSACDAASHSENATQRLIRENVKQLIEQLEAGKSEALTAYLRAMANFRTYQDYVDGRTMLSRAMKPGEGAEFHALGLT